MSNPEIQVGIDVSKESLEISSFDRGSSSVPNTRAGMKRLMGRFLKHPGPIKVCCEATGGYERLLVAACHDAEVPIAVVNARQVRDFARSKNILAKTDALDAQVLASYAKENHPRLTPKPPAWRLRLQALLNRRDELNGMITQENNRLETLEDPEIRRMIRAHVRSMETQKKKLLSRIESMICDHQELQIFCEKMTSVKGIGRLTAVSLYAYIPELGQITDNQVSALAGLAPWCRDSGNWREERRVSGGRSQVRKALYMPAITASRTNPILKEYYDQLIQKGKPAKVALTAVMRKLVRLANKVAANPDFMPA